MSAFIKKIPVPIAGLALGLVALGNLLAPYGDVFRYIFAALSVGMISLLVARIILHPRMMRGDFRSSIFASVFGTFFMTFMQLSTVLALWNTGLAFGLWIAAVVGHLAWIVWFSLAYIAKFQLDEVFPTYFIAYVGIIVASVTAPVFHMEVIGEALFWFGLACYAVLLVLVSLRYAKYETPEPAKPLFCIYAAPMSLSLAGYLTSVGSVNIIMVSVMAVLAQMMLILALTQLPKLLRLRFYPSYAAMTFPFVITATALGKTLAYFTDMGYAVPQAFEWLLAAETLFAALMVCYVLVRYLGFSRDLIVGIREEKQFVDLDRAAQSHQVSVGDVAAAAVASLTPADSSEDEQAPSALPVTN